jgi:hypothetical protein
LSNAPRIEHKYADDNSPPERRPKPTTGYLQNLGRGPGRHGISNACFLYVRCRDGHRVEFYTSDYQTIDPDHESLRWSQAV